MSHFNAERWPIVSPYLDLAMDMPEPQRAAWLASLEARDPALAAELQTLLGERDAATFARFLDASAAPASLEGRTVGAYTLESLIGSGGMGSVWLARRHDGRFERRVAVKVLNAVIAGRAAEARFTREGRILGRLAHPHIARLIDAGVSDAGHSYLVLEHVEGEPIDRYCETRRLDTAARLRIFLDVLDAVAHAHVNLIVHRDIKPSNVLVTRDGEAKLLDFGIATLLDRDADLAAVLTRDGARAMTPAYAAPEQMTGGAITTATDVYALGVLLFVLLAQRHPAGDALASPADLLRAVVDRDAPRLSEVDPRLAGDLDTIVAKALKRSPGERYASASALADDIRRYLAHEPIAARRDSAVYRASKFVRRNRRAVTAVVAATIALVGVIAFYTSRLATERDLARREAAKSAKVTELLSGLLQSSDPYSVRSDRERTVGGLLDAAATRLPKELAGQPDVEVEMLEVLGKIDADNSQPDKAEPLLRQAIDIGRRTLGADDPRVAQSLNTLGVVLRNKGDRTAAKPLLEEALRIRRKRFGENHQDVAVTLEDLGTLYQDEGSLDQAERLFRESLAIRRKVLGDGDHETATSLNDLALVLRDKGQYAEAETLLLEALAIYRRVSGPEHPDVATTLNNLSLAAQDRHDFVTAEARSRESVAIARKALGDAHPGRVSGLNNFAYALREEGKYDEAAAVLNEALRVAVPALGDDHWLVAVCRVNLARVDLARGNASAARTLLASALRSFEKTMSPHHWRIAVTESLLGAALTQLGQFDEAERLLVDANEVLEKVPGQADEARDARARLAALHSAAGR